MIVLDAVGRSVKKARFGGGSEYAPAVVRFSVLWLVVAVGCASALLEPPAPGLRARQTAQWSRAVSGVARPGDLVVARLYGGADDEAMAGATRPFSRLGILDDDGGVVFGWGELALRRPLAAVLHEAHRLVLVRLEVGEAARTRLAQAARATAGQALEALSVSGGGARERGARFVAWAFEHAGLTGVRAPADPADGLDLGTLVFDSGARY